MSFFCYLKPSNVIRGFLAKSFEGDLGLWNKLMDPPLFAFYSIFISQFLWGCTRCPLLPLCTSMSSYQQWLLIKLTSNDNSILEQNMMSWTTSKASWIVTFALLSFQGLEIDRPSLATFSFLDRFGKVFVDGQLDCVNLLNQLNQTFNLRPSNLKNSTMLSKLVLG